MLLLTVSFVCMPYKDAQADSTQTHTHSNTFQQLRYGSVGLHLPKDGTKRMISKEKDNLRQKSQLKYKILI